MPEAIAAAVKQGNLVACAVLSGNRNFEGRINPVVRFNYLASPPLVVAYAIAGTMDFDLEREPLGQRQAAASRFTSRTSGRRRARKSARRSRTSIDSAMFRKEYGQVFEGDERWRGLKVPEGDLFSWEQDSTYVKAPPFFDGVGATPPPLGDISDARVLAMLGRQRDHRSHLARRIDRRRQSRRQISDRSWRAAADFNSYGARRGNHEVMVRGTFANIRLRNRWCRASRAASRCICPTANRPRSSRPRSTIAPKAFPLIVIAGKEYGSGSSRDWAAKGTQLLGVRAVIAESYERIHRSNLVGMGVLPLQFTAARTRKTLGLTGREFYSIDGLAAGVKPAPEAHGARRGGRQRREFEVLARIDTPEEVEYMQPRRDPALRAARTAPCLRAHEIPRTA